MDMPFHPVSPAAPGEQTEDVISLNRLREAVRLFTSYLRIPIFLSSRGTVPLHAFQDQGLFMERLQPCYQTACLSDILRNGGKKAICRLNDPLGTHAIIVMADDIVILMGPFVPETWKEQKAKKTLARYIRFSSEHLLRYKLWWCGLRVCEPEAALRAAYTMLEYAGYMPDHFTSVDVSPSADFREAAEQQNPELSYQRNSLQNVEERYAQESAMMHEVSEGHRDAAVHALRQMLHHSRPQAGMTVDLWTQETAMAIMRNLIRIAAKESGLDAVIVDSISVEYAQKMRQITGEPREAARLYEQMISELCEEIRKVRENGYSILTQRALHLIHLYCGEQLTIQSVAEKVYASESTLSRALKADTGSTFTALLSRERLQKAGHLLRETSESVQNIAAACGYPDQNYFVKVFRKQYGVTPTEYRKASHLLRST